MPPSSDDLSPTSEPACPVCNDAGYYCLDVPISDPNFGHLISCECKLREKMDRRQSELRRLSNLQAFEDKDFASFNPDVPGVRSVFVLCQEYARNPQGWLFLFGGYGCGKTHLAAAIANEAIRREYDTMFTVVPDLLDHLRSTFGPSSEIEYDERFELIRNIQLLILDDLGTESATPWAREKLFQIMNHRYNLRLPTVITSNGNLDKLDPRLHSRLQDVVLCRRVLIEAGDYRRLTIQQRYSNFRSYGN